MLIAWTCRRWTVKYAHTGGGSRHGPGRRAGSQVWSFSRLDVTDENNNGETPLSPDRDQLLAQVYDQLRAIARARLSHESPGHSLQATELVHEAYLKLQNHPALGGSD